MSKVMQNASKMMCTRVTKHYENPAAGERVCNRFARMADEMVSRLDRRPCFFYDPDVRLGGPNPEEGSEYVRWWGEKKDGKYRALRMAPRLRRDAEDDEEDDYDEDDYYGIVNGCDDIDPDADEDLAQFCDTDFDYVTVEVPCEGAECLTRGKVHSKLKTAINHIL